MSHHNPNIPGDYNPAPDGLKAPTFSAPAHNFSSSQAEQIVELAEGSHRDTNSGMSGSGGAGYGGSSSSTGYGSGSGMSTGGAGYGSGMSTGDAGYRSGSNTGYPGDGTGQGIMNTGSTTQSLPRQSGDYQLGRNDDNRSGQSSEYGSSGHGHGLSGRETAGMGAGAAGLGAAGMASSHHGSGSGNHTGETPRESSGNISGGRLDSTANSGSGPVASSGSLEHSLQSELERNARKKGTHAAGFGTAGMSSDTGALNHESSGVSRSGNAGGYSSGTGSGSGMTGGMMGQSGTTGYEQGYQQGLQQQQGGLSQGGLAHAGEVENRAHGSGSDNVTGLGSSGVNAHHGSTTGRAL